MNTDCQWSRQEAFFCTRDSDVARCQSQVSYLANEIGVRSELIGQVNLAAVNQMCVIHEAINACKNLKIHLRIALTMLIFYYFLFEIFFMNIIRFKEYQRVWIHIRTNFCWS